MTKYSAAKPRLKMLKKRLEKSCPKGDDGGKDAMKRILYIGVLFLLFVNYAAQAQSTNQNAADARDKVVAEAKKGGYQLITPEELKDEYLKDAAAFLFVD